MQLQQFGASHECQMLRVGAKMFLFTIVMIFSGFVVGQVATQYHGDPDDIIFPGPLSSGPKERALGKPAKDVVRESNAISVDLAARLNSIDSVDEFMQLLQGVPQNVEGPSTFLHSRVGEGKERSNAVTPPQAKCMPELQPVSLKVDDDPSLIVFPSCTRINRCGGCCGSALLSCQPVATEIRNFQVIVSTIELQFRGKRIVPVEEHTKCTCDCKLKEENCNDKQHYEPHNCMCICNNVDEEEKCRQSNGTKIWDAERCLCSCRNVEPCTTGYYFNYNTCRCGAIALTRPLDRFASTKGTNYDFSNRRPPNVPPVQVFPLDPTDPRRRHKEDPEYK